MNQLGRVIRDEILATGPIPFQRFMELALYHPEFGYYERAADPVGFAGADYFTSCAVGPVFGELLAVRLAEWLSSYGDAPLALVEAGAHDGSLARSILSWLDRERPELCARLTYWILEPSRRRRARQQQQLAGCPGSLAWMADWEEWTDSERPAVLFSNELLDAFPVRRVGWDALEQAWFEWGVTTQGDELIEIRLPASGQVPDLPEELRAVLPDGFTTELHSAAVAWWERAARALVRGKLMTIDYGFETEDFFRPERPLGTLRAYRQHQVSRNLFECPGEQDLTAHINFSALRRAGERLGLRTEQFESQATFLTRAAEVTWSRSGGSVPDAKWVRQFQTLTHPEHLGRKFWVLVQGRSSETLGAASV